MKRIATICSIIAALLMNAAPMAFADTVDWKGLTWNIRGAANSATVISGDYLSISVVGGSSGDPRVDNWVLSTPFTNAMWMKFTFVNDTPETGTSGPRAYAEGRIPGGVMLLQGGARSDPIATQPPVEGPLDLQTWVNTNVVTGSSWPVSSWTSSYSNLPPGEHTYKVGLGSNGEIDIFYDSILVQSYRLGQSYWTWNNDDDYVLVPFVWDAQYLQLAYLGGQVAVGSTATIIYKDFEWGTSYQPVPVPGTVVLLGSGLMGLVIWGRRRLAAKS